MHCMFVSISILADICKKKKKSTTTAKDATAEVMEIALGNQPLSVAKDEGFQCLIYHLENVSKCLPTFYD